MSGNESAETALIGVDWGTTQLRGFRIGGDGSLLECRQSEFGIAAIRNGEFDSALRTLIADWQPSPGALPILMCGMIGSRQGWREVSYQACPARLTDLIQGLAKLDTSCGPAFIIGGISTFGGDGRHDIMRGEETQILGGTPSAGRYLVVAPGTHSKWAVVEDGRVEDFRTFMTGEIYDLLRNRSSLAWLMNDTDEDGDEDAFLEGARRGSGDSNLLNLLFSVRTSGLFDNRPSNALSSYLSGLLIGSEIAGALRRQSGSPILVIATPALSRLYELAISAAGLSRVESVDARETTVRGLWRLWQMRTLKVE